MANTLTFANLSLTDAHIFGGISFQHDINTGEEFTIGNTASASVTFVTDTQLPLYTNDAVNGTFTWTKGDTARGRFYITEVTKAARKYTITAYDAMILLDTNISALSVSLPATVSELASAIATYCGCTVSGTIVNGSLSVSSLDADMTIRQLLTYIAEASGCSVKIDGSDHLCFMYYVDSGITITSSDYITLEVADYVCAAIDNVTIFNSTGEIQATYGSGGNSLYIGQNPFLENATNANAQAIYAKVSGITYAPLKAELFDESGLEIGTIATFGTTPTLVMHIDSSEGGANVSSVGSDNRAGYNKNAVVIANEARAIAIDTQSIASAASGLLSDMQAAAAAAGTTLEGIYADAEAAQSTLGNMQTAATAAGTTLTQIYSDAKEAQAQALNAGEYAARALGGLSSVQTVTETLTWIAQHGTMTLTSDVALDPTHVYFVADANGDYVVGNNHYSIVTEPDVADIATYYELSIDESLNNYVGTHLALTSEGLWILPESTDSYKVLVATGNGSIYTTAGTYIIDSGNSVVAMFGAGMARIGAEDDVHVNIEAEGMKVMSGSDEKARFSDGIVSMGDNTGRFEVTPTKTTFYGNNSQEVGYIGQGAMVSGSFTDTLLTQTKVWYTIPCTIYDDALSYAPESDIALHLIANDVETNVTIPHLQDYSNTINDVQIAYTAQTHNLSVIYNGSNVTIASTRGTINGIPSHAMYGNAMKDASLRFVFEYNPVSGSTITFGRGYLLSDLTFTVGTPTSIEDTPFFSNAKYRIVYDGNKTITVTYVSGDTSDSYYVSNIHYYTQGVKVSVLNATYDRSYMSPVYSFGSNNDSRGHSYVTMIGEGLESWSDDQFIVGKYNTGRTAPFVLGGGTSTTRSDLFVITRDGDLYIHIDSNASSGTKDGDLCNALSALGWQIYSY